MVSVAMPLSQQAGYYCNVCDCVLRDSQSYLDHINGALRGRAARVVPWGACGPWTNRLASRAVVAAVVLPSPFV